MASSSASSGPDMGPGGEPTPCVGEAAGRYAEADHNDAERRFTGERKTTRARTTTKPQRHNGAVDATAGFSVADRKRRQTSTQDGARRRSETNGDACIAKTIEAEVIPRLLMAHRDTAECTHPSLAPADGAGAQPLGATAYDWLQPAFAPAFRVGVAAQAGPARSPAASSRAEDHKRPPDAQDADGVDMLAHLAVHGEVGALMRVVEQAMHDGETLEHVFLKRLAPAARRLGDMWNEDVYSFADVTVGLCRLRQVFEELRAHGDLAACQREALVALVAAAPGDQHSFGAAMAAHFFTQAGWTVISESRGDEDVLIRLLTGRHIDLLGLSLNTDQALAGLGRFVMKAKRDSKNRNLVIMIGGSLATARPDIAREHGLVLATGDPRLAIAEAETIVRRAARRI